MGVPPALDKSMIGGLKGPLGPLAVIGQTEAHPRGHKTAGGQAPPREGVVPSWGKDHLMAHLMRPPYCNRGEARGRRVFHVKPHDYGGAVLSNGAETGTKGASPPGSRRVVWR
jgi:hypothetical protein